MATAKMYDVIVVGAGVEGSATARHLVTTGTKNVLLLEQVRACANQFSFSGGKVRGSRISEGGAQSKRVLVRQRNGYLYIYNTFQGRWSRVPIGGASLQIKLCVGGTFLFSVLVPFTKIRT